MMLMMTLINGPAFLQPMRTQNHFQAALTNKCSPKKSIRSCTLRAVGEVDTQDTLPFPS